jgi:hypothetical protein
MGGVEDDVAPDLLEAATNESGGNGAGMGLEDVAPVALEAMTDDSLFKLPRNDRGSIKYHPNLPADKLKGRLGYLTQSEEHALSDMTKQVDREKIVSSRIQIPGEPIETLLLRFLRARNFVVKDALLMLNTSVDWRLQEKINTISENDWTKVPQDKIFEYYPFFYWCLPPSLPLLPPPSHYFLPCHRYPIFLQTYT